MPQAKGYFPNREPACWLECGHIADWWGAIHQIGERRSGKAIWTQYCKVHDKWLEIVQDVMPGEYGNPPKRVTDRARRGGYIHDSLF